MHPGHIHPGVAAWWHARRAAAFGESGCGAEADAGPRGRWRGWGHSHGHDGHHGHHASPPDFDGGDPGAGAFGVRRPLRFLAYKLELSEEQVAEMARVLDDLKTERAQGAVDHRRTTASFADAVAGESFDEKSVAEAAASRVKSAERLRDAVVKALARIHAVLTPEQRGKLAYLLRTGALSI
jgi:Spy/CpxP family protein refolding chaperone